jgi:hypothetical protein
MNIYALEGFKVILRFGSTASGWEKARKLLDFGTIYTVEKTEVHNSHTDVWLKEVPGESFNSVLLEDFSRQSVEADARHPDWPRYHQL